VSNSDTPIDEHPLDDVAAYALDALDGPERQAVRDHLAGCPTCRDELTTHQETLVLLAPEEAPPPALWDRIKADIAGPASTPTPAPAPVTPLPSSTPTSSRPRWGGGWLAAAAAVVVALGVGGAVGFAAGQSGDDADIDTLAQQATEVATLSSPSGGDPVARVVSDDDGAYLVLDGLDNLPEGRAYQLWSLTDAEPVSLGMLGRDGTNTVAFRLPPTITDLAITEAPTSGDATPAGDFIAEGTIAA